MQGLSKLTRGIPDNEQKKKFTRALCLTKNYSRWLHNACNVVKQLPDIHVGRLYPWPVLWIWFVRVNLQSSASLCFFFFTGTAIFSSIGGVLFHQVWLLHGIFEDKFPQILLFLDNANFFFWPTFRTSVRNWLFLFFGNYGSCTSILLLP